MKREVCCVACGKKWREMIGKYDDEHIFVVDGISKKTFRCDGCNALLPDETEVACISVLAYNQEYVPWESNFIRRPKSR